MNYADNLEFEGVNNIEFISVSVAMPIAKPSHYATFITEPIALIHSDRPEYPLVGHAIYTNSIHHAGAGIAIEATASLYYEWVMWHSVCLDDLRNPFKRKDKDYTRYNSSLFGSKITHWAYLPKLPTKDYTP
jgi:hypothetical protein